MLAGHYRPEGVLSLVEIYVRQVDLDLVLHLLVHPLPILHSIRDLPRLRDSELAGRVVYLLSRERGGKMDNMSCIGFVILDLGIGICSPFRAHYLPVGQ